MNGHLLKVNSKHLPKDFPREFDAHIYFDEDSYQEASLFREKCLKHFEQSEVFVGFMIDRPIGPHPLPMFEINFPRNLFGEVVLWLLHHHGKHSILVHELTGDDYLDHTDYALWIGKTIELDISAFGKKN
ncbi:MAG: DOPA 4,5-dioxygenase family protein [Bacteriovoracaceae bacterium]